MDSGNKHCISRLETSDPPGIRVRPIEGPEGITSLIPGAITSSVSWVMGPLIQVFTVTSFQLS